MKLFKPGTLFFALYAVALIILSDFFCGAFLNARLGLDGQLNAPTRIAIIDMAFDLRQFNQKNIANPLNVHEHSSKISKIPHFDTHGNLVFSNHGTEIMNLFIGKFGLLKNAIIIPIQISSSDDLEDALRHAINNDAQIISISLSFGETRALDLHAKVALLNASQHVPILIAAGNNGIALENTLYGKSILKLVNESNQKIWLIGATKMSLIPNFRHKPYFQEVQTNFSNYSKAQAPILWLPGQNIKIGSFFKKLLSLGVSGTSIATPLAAIKAIYVSNKYNISIEQALDFMHRVDKLSDL